MNRRQKLVQEQFLNNEEAVIRRVKSVYGQALKDITSKAEALQLEIDRLGKLANLATDEDEKARFLSMQQSKIYQKQYQDAMKKQVGSILDNMQVEEFKAVSEYLEKCYEDGFIGTMFDLQGQGIPLCFPLDQEAVVRAVQLDSKISQGLYSRLGEDVALLKKKITAQVSRGIATGMSFQQVAQQLSAYTNIGYNNAIRIARTEGHRIQIQGTMDACYKAKDRGADVVKQWDSTLDDATRESHVAVDGEIRELDEKFSNGLMFPGDPSGGAAEVVNCRCALLQRARWALDEAELQTLQDRAEFFGLDKAETFEDYKKKYLKATSKTTFESLKLSGIDADYLPDIEDTFNGLMRDYPLSGIRVKTHSSNEEFGHSIGGIKGVTRNGEQYAIVDNEISISKQLHKNHSDSVNAHRETYSNNGSKLQFADRADLATIPHEYAHAIDNAYVLAKDKKMHAFVSKYQTAQKVTEDDIEFITDFNIALSKSNYRLSKEIFDELQEEYGLTYGGTIMRIADEYGMYASSSISEFLAEGFANMRVLDDKDKTEFMLSFEKIFNRKYKEVLGE